MNVFLNLIRRQVMLSMCAVLATCFLNFAHADETENTNKAVDPASTHSSELKRKSNTQAEQGRAQDEKETKLLRQAIANEKSALRTSSDWTFHFNAGLGGARFASEKGFKSDRLSIGVFAGKKIDELSHAIALFENTKPTLGLSYQTLGGVDAETDRLWSVQSLGAQARIEFAALPNNSLDLLLHSGICLQRMVGEESLRRSEITKYGAALTGSLFARTFATDGVYAFGGAALIFGSVSAMSINVGLETNF